MPKQERGYQGYQRRSKEVVRERAAMRGGDFDSIIKPKYKVYKVRDGKNVVRIMPPTWGDATHYGYDLFVNYNIGVDNQSYLSLSKMKGEADPLADARRAAEKAGNKEMADALKPRQRIAMWVIDRLDEDEGPQLWLAPFTVDKDILNLSMDEDTKEVTYIDDPEEGCDVRFYKEGTGKATRYPAAQMRILKPSPLHDDEGLQNEWLDFVQENSIPDCLQFYDAEHISSAFGGNLHIEDSDDEDDKPRGKRSRVNTSDDEDETPRSRRGRAAPVDDEEPAPRSRRKPVDEDEEDSEPEPRKRSRPEPEPEPRSRRGRVTEPADEDEDDEKEPEKAAPKQSLRDRLKSRRSAEADDDDTPF